MEPKISIKRAAEILGVTTQALHKKMKKIEMPLKRVGRKGYLTHEDARKLFSFKFKKRVCAVQVVKGGVGKSSIACNLAVAANLFGAKVLCIDLDQQANLTSSFGIKATSENPIMIDVIEGDAAIKDCIIEVFPGLDIIPSRIDNALIETVIITARKTNLKKLYTPLINSIRDRYDFIIIDCPPALGYSVGAAALSADYILSPVAPEGQSLEGLELTLQEFKTLEKDYDSKINVKILNNKFNSRTSLSQTILADLLGNPETKNKVLRTTITASQEIPNCYFKGASVFDSLSESVSRNDFELLIQELEEIGEYSIESEVETKTKLSEVVF